jgi:proline racemase
MAAYHGISIGGQSANLKHQYFAMENSNQNTDCARNTPIAPTKTDQNPTGTKTSKTKNCIRMTHGDAW